MIVARNQVRANLPSFGITGVSKLSGIHYSWRWNVTSTCDVHFVMLNEYVGHVCDGCAPANCFYGPPCYTGWTWPEDSLSFLTSVLSDVVGTSGEPVFVMQHYCFDGYSNTWYSEQQRLDMWMALKGFNVAGILCGHTHSAAIYAFNGTDQLPFGSSAPGSIDVYNIPSTQKEDAKGFPAPSEFMAFELAVDETGNGTLRAAQRVAWGWGDVTATKTVACPSRR